MHNASQLIRLNIIFYTKEIEYSLRGGKHLRDRLVDYHLKSKGNLRRLYQYVKKDAELYDALDKLDIRMPYESRQIDFFSKEAYPESQRKINIQFEQLGQQNIQVVTIFDASYPQRLKEIFSPPLVLYVKGRLEYLKRVCVSVIGTRTPSEEAYPIVQRIVPPLVQRQVCIVSGLANGIDTYAHLVAEKFQGMTIAVLGGGFNHIYPKSNSNLASKIEKQHLLLSEYPPDLSPQKWRFVERNRIIAGLSLATIVIEAREKSGTLITAQIALEEGREVFAVPGSILCEESVGCNQLIQEGAHLICDGKEIFELYKWASFDS